MSSEIIWHWPGGQDWALWVTIDPEGDRVTTISPAMRQTFMSGGSVTPPQEDEVEAKDFAKLSDLTRRQSRAEMKFMRDGENVPYMEEHKDIRDEAKALRDKYRGKPITTDPGDTPLPPDIGGNTVITRLTQQEVNAYERLHFDFKERTALRKDNSGKFFADWRKHVSDKEGIHDGPFPGCVEAIDHLGKVTGQ